MWAKFPLCRHCVWDNCRFIFASTYEGGCARVLVGKVGDRFATLATTGGRGENVGFRIANFGLCGTLIYAEDAEVV